MLTIYFLRLYNGEPLHKTIERIGTPDLSIFGWPEHLGTGESVAFR